MSAIGTKRTYQVALHMSAFGGKADITIKRLKCLLLTQSGHRYELCLSKRPQSERCQNRPRRGPAALSSLWTSGWLIAPSLFIGPDLFGGTGGMVF